MNQFHQNFIIRVIDLYGLELDDRQIDTLVVAWLQTHDPSWIVKAIVESLYRGRYKIKSVDNILKDWHRLGKPRHNFTPEYEREILQNLPDPLDVPVAIVPLPSSSPDIRSSPVAQPQYQNSVVAVSDTQLVAHQPLLVSSKNLDPEESAPFGRHHQSSNFQVDPQVEIPVVETANLENLPSIDDSEQDNAGCTFTSLPQLSSGILKGSASGNAKSDDRSHRSAIQPVKHHLFTTLKAIVDPNHQQGSAAYPSVCLPLYVVNPNPPHIRQFQPPIEHPSEEQCL